MSQNIFSDLTPQELLQKYKEIAIDEHSHPYNVSYHRAIAKIEKEILSRMGEEIITHSPTLSPVYKSSLARIRKEKGLTQSALAAAVGVSTQSISEWERGNVFPRPVTCRILARVLHCSVAEIFDSDAKPNSE